MGLAVLLFVVIGLIPFFYEIWYSFTNWDGIHANYQFVGLKNYIDVLTNDPKYWHAMWFTIKFAFCVLIFSNVLGFIWAYGLSKAIPFRNVMRAGFYIPRIVGGVVLGFLEIYYHGTVSGNRRGHWNRLVLPELVPDGSLFLLGDGNCHDLEHGRLYDDYLCGGTYFHFL